MSAMSLARGLHVEARVAARVACVEARVARFAARVEARAPTSSFRHFHAPARTAPTSFRHYRATARTAPTSFHVGARLRHFSTQDNDAHDDAHDAHDAKHDRSLTALRTQELAAAGALVYPRYRPVVDDRMPVATFHAQFASTTTDETADDTREKPRVELAGRVLSVRRMGAKLAFLRIQDEGETVQVLCNQRILETETTEFKRQFKLLARGDHVAVTGRAVRTPTGELTLAADALPRVYAPALAPLPVRLADGDTRVRRRHVDLLVHAERAALLRLRALLVREVRAHLESQRFVEVPTPILADVVGGAAARPFVTSHGDNGDTPLTLRIAPELWLKRLVVGGLDRVFELGPSFRNEGIDATHNPEFTTCEFYAAYWSLPELLAQTEQLLTRLARAALAFRRDLGPAVPADSHLSPDRVSASVQRIAAGPPFLQLEFVPALETALGFTLPDLADADAYDRLRTRLADHGHALAAGTEDVADADGGRLAKLLDRLAGMHLEPQSFTDAHGRPHGPLFIMHHPACMAPLAKSFVCPRTGQLVSARAELFVDGRELANMYEEENDPAEQRRKMQAQAEEQQSEKTVDENYISALASGLPPTGGWGGGIERLVMLMSGAPRIADVLTFGTLQHVVAMKN